MDPMEALKAMGNYIKVSMWNYWLAAGIKFSSFKMINAYALLVVDVGKDFQVGLLGTAWLSAPPETSSPVVNAVMALEAVFSLRKGLIAVSAALTSGSYIISKDCRITGDFSYYTWLYEGGFVVNLGGYHPDFVKPKHYPDGARLGLKWELPQYGVTIKGGGYFALTPSCIMITLPPRIVKPSRLELSWVSAGKRILETGSVSAPNPVCGWLMPNLSDRSLLIYDDCGLLMGSLVEAYGTVSCIRWVDTPGKMLAESSENAEPNIGNLHLKKFVLSLLKYGRRGISALGDLLDIIGRTLLSTEPFGEKSDPGFSAFLGRPLALVRSSLQLEIDGLPAYSQNWDKLGKKDTGSLKNASFPVRLGDINNIADGLIGYFIDKGDENTYLKFYSVSEEKKGAKQSEYIVKNNQIDLNCTGKEDRVVLSMLVDPRAAVHVTSGIVPAKSVELPQDYIGSALKNLDITFMVNPLLNDPSNFKMSVPSGSEEWTWVYLTATAGKKDWKLDKITQNADDRASLSSEKLQITEGWLKLSVKSDRQ
jgi:hypothetical protein